MNNSTPDSHSSPGFILWRLGAVWRQKVQELLALHNLTHPQFIVLAGISELSRRGERPSQARVADYCGMDPATVSQVVRRLEKAGLIHRKLSEVDQRTKTLFTSEKGRNTLQEAWPDICSIDQPFLKEEKAELMEFVRSLQDILSA